MYRRFRVSIDVTLIWPVAICLVEAMAKSLRQTLMMKMDGWLSGSSCAAFKLLKCFGFSTKGNWFNLSDVGWGGTVLVLIIILHFVSQQKQTYDKKAIITLKSMYLLSTD